MSDLNMEMTLLKSINDVFKSKNENDFFKDIFHAINHSSIISMTDKNGVITFANDNFCKISKYSKDELLGKTHSIVNSGYHDKVFFRNMWSVISKGNVWKGVIRNKAKDGTFYWVFTTILPLFNSEKQVSQYLSIRYDVSKEKDYELEMDVARNHLVELKNNQEMSERFVSAVAHDLKTPLTVAKLSTQYIEKNAEDLKIVTNHLEKIKQNINRVDEMVNDLLNASKIRAGHRIQLSYIDCDCEKVISSALEGISIIYGDRFKLDAHGDCNGRWAASGIKRVIENLCTNAIKYGDKNKIISVSVYGKKDELEISVHNFGKALNSREIDKLFNYLERSLSAQNSGQPGWGIGLTLVKGIVESHGGHVKVRSVENEGTTFTVILPRLNSIIKKI